jgi:hypothetical protein
MIVEGDMLYSMAATFVAISFLYLWRLETKKLHKKKDECRKKAYAKLAGYRSHSDHPRHEFSGKDTSVILRKEEFSLIEGRLAGIFICLCRNAFDEYFFCVIDMGLSAIHIPKERALHFLKDFPKEYAAEIDYLASRLPIKHKA